MRATAMLLAAAVLLLIGTSAHAQPAFLRPPGVCIPPNPVFYGPGACPNACYGPTYCFQGACLPPRPFNGVLPFATPAMPGYAPPGYPGVAGPIGFPTHPFARSPRDFFMYGQQWTE